MILLGYYLSMLPASVINFKRRQLITTVQFLRYFLRLTLARIVDRSGSKSTVAFFTLMLDRSLETKILYQRMSAWSTFELPAFYIFQVLVYLLILKTVRVRKGLVLNRNDLRRNL